MWIRLAALTQTATPKPQQAVVPTSDSQREVASLPLGELASDSKSGSSQQTIGVVGHNLTVSGELTEDYSPVSDYYKLIVHSMSTLAAQKKGPPFCLEDVKSTLVKQASGSWELAGFGDIDDYLEAAEHNGVINLRIDGLSHIVISPGRNVRSWIIYL